MKQSNTLKLIRECPLCRGDADIHPTVTRIFCTDCRIVMCGVQGRELLIEAWNTRPSPISKEDARRALDTSPPL